MTTPEPARTPSPARPEYWRILLGLALLLPAALCCLGTLLGPTLQTFLLSLRSGSFLSAGDFVGPENYRRLLGLAPIAGSIRFALRLLGTRLAAAAILPLLLALAANELGDGARKVIRLVFSLPLALYAPVALAGAWALALAPGQTLADVRAAPRVLLRIDGVLILGVACAVGLIAYLAALRSPAAEGSGWRRARGPVLFVWLLSLTAVVAAGLQTFALPYVMTAGGPLSSTLTPALAYYQTAFVTGRFGAAAALAAILLAVIMMLGVVAGLLVIGSGLRLATVSPRETGARLLGRTAGIALLTLCLLVVVGLWLWNNGPLAGVLLQSMRRGGGTSRLTEAVPVGRVLLNTYVRPLVAVVLVQLPVAYLGGLAIGALRPLGRRSDWLLLPFSPWLFVTLGPLTLPWVLALQRAGLWGTLAVWLPTLSFSVPMLFVLTLFFKGRAARWRAARASGRSALSALAGELLWPSWPLALFLALLALLVQTQDLEWPLVAAREPISFTGNLALMWLRGQYFAQPTAAPVFGAAIVRFLLPGFLFFSVAFGILHILYLDHVVLTRDELGALAGLAQVHEAEKRYR